MFIYLQNRGKAEIKIKHKNYADVMVESFFKLVQHYFKDFELLFSCDN